MKLRVLGALGALLLAVWGCASQPNQATLGHVRVQLTDAPADYEQVNLVVTGVSIHRDGGGWESIKDDTTTYDLLTLRGGVFATLGEADVPTGHYTQVRLHIGAGSNVVVDGVTYPLDVPSGLQSGYKLVGEFDVAPDAIVDLTLDFDAARSIVVSGAGDYKLKPTVRVTLTDAAAQIRGRILPAGTAAIVYAIAGADTVQSADADGEGRFTLAALFPGTYDVAVHPAAGYRDTTLAGVTVGPAEIKDVGDVQLTPKATGSSDPALIGSAP